MLLKFKTQNRRESVPFLQPVEELPVYDLIVAGLRELKLLSMMQTRR